VNAVRWIDRSGLSGRAGAASGLLNVAPAADVVFPFTAPDRTAQAELTAAALSGAGVGARDRVVVALNSDGDLTGARVAEAAASLAQAACSVGPRGRMRLLAAIEAVRATALVATPTGAADFLARLHMEFLVDPLDLELRHLVLAGEIADPATYRHLAAEFGAAVWYLYVDPVFGTGLAAGDATDAEAGLDPVQPGLLAAAPFAEDRLLDLGAADGRPEGGRAELVVRPTWHSHFADTVIRTGEVVSLSPEAKGLPAPSHTVGDHILIRGRWLSLSRLRAALSKIDGIGQWRLVVRRDGTLDVASLEVAFMRKTLIDNPMWRSRIADALYTVTPVAVGIDVAPELSEGAAAPVIEDRRGHHLAQQRATAH
jgi:phenylacetate-CoA ligase